MLHNEDRELQIKLAELQSRIQLHLTINFGLLVAILAIIITYIQTAYSLPPERESQGRILLLLAGMLVGVFLSFFGYIVYKVRQLMGEFKELRKRYVW